MRIRISFFLIILFLQQQVFAQQKYVKVKEIDYTKVAPFKRDSILTAKICYLLVVFEHDKRLKSAISKDEILQQRSLAYLQRFKVALSCKNSLCYAVQLKWNDQEIASIGNALIRLNRKKAFSAALIPQLKKQPFYINYQQLPDNMFLRRAWMDVAQAINHIVGVYLAGEKTKYAIIDSISFNTAAPDFTGTINKKLADLNRGMMTGNPAFYELPLKVALKALELNGRNEAARYEPLTQGKNKSAAWHVKNTQWNRYQYSAILVPGFGPEVKGIRIDSESIQRCKLAAERYRKGLAPFLITSGGHVYPIRTPFSEGVEMKRYLVEQLGIPANAIIVEPHARHTTTNIRNAIRLIYRLGIPHNKPILAVTDSAQTEMIMNTAARCIRELGYVPFKGLKKLNKNDSSFLPKKSAFQNNINDPLDP